ncbi:unnamed protein product [Fraxinus pennsylvanica]|uniref:Uncharacterized protein n=1 Tax=Fraxinus pennsylvanica TaxID=56036 RepID=A0AAD2A986_9LAMI|nr:unnamed protein product [Fraxinus pennsylvanica]
MWNSSRVSAFDIQHQINGPGLEFSSVLMVSDHIQHNVYNNAFISTEQIQDVTNPNSVLSGTESSTFDSTSTMASLPASSLQQQKIVSTGMKDIQVATNFPGLSPFTEIQAMYPTEQINSADLYQLWNTTGEKEKSARLFALRGTSDPPLLIGQDVLLPAVTVSSLTVGELLVIDFPSHFLSFSFSLRFSARTVFCFPDFTGRFIPNPFIISTFLKISPNQSYDFLKIWCWMTIREQAFKVQALKLVAELL